MIVVEICGDMEILTEKTVDFDRLSPFEQLQQIELEEVWTAAEVQKRQFLRRQRNERKRIAERLDMMDRFHRMVMAFNTVF